VLAATFLFAAALLAAPQAAPAPARSHTIVGELARVDYDRGELTVRAPKEGRDHVLPVGADTRYVGGGRALQLADLRPGDPVVVVCSDDARGHRVTLVKTGASRYAAPVPGARRQ
jgi:hypothetical protein